MKLVILIVLLLLACFVLWPKRPPRVNDLGPKEIVYMWTIGASMQTGLILISRWETDDRLTISIDGPIEETQEEMFDHLVEDLKKKLPGITISINVKN